MNRAVPPAFYWVENVLSVLGAGIAGTLWWAHRAAIDLPCTADGGCEVIAASRWAHVTVGPWHDVPVALLGFLSYLVLLTLAMMKLGAETERACRLLHIPFWAISLGGFGYSWFLQYVAHFKIGAFCVWCFSSATVMTLLFITATAEGLRRSRRPRGPVAPSESRPISHV